MFCFFLCINQPGYPDGTDSFFFMLLLLLLFITIILFFIFVLQYESKKVLVCIVYYGRTIAHSCPITWRYYGYVCVECTTAVPFLKKYEEKGLTVEYFRYSSS